MIDILLIEDDENIRFLIEEELALDGFEVRSAADGQSGLDSFGEAAPDLVLLDLMMPGIPGEEVLRRLKAVAPKLPVIIYSAYADRQDPTLRLGADAFVVKSADLELLKTTIRRFVQP